MAIEQAKNGKWQIGKKGEAIYSTEAEAKEAYYSILCDRLNKLRNFIRKNS